ncbi:MAG: hypothetical protein ACUVTO_07825, partial [Candidatus Caldatribacteriaceae bacterium]
MKVKARVIAKWIGLVFIAIFVLSPLLWGLKVSLTPRYEVSFFPSQMTLEHYHYIFSRPEFLNYTRN